MPQWDRYIITIEFGSNLVLVYLRIGQVDLKRAEFGDIRRRGARVHVKL